MEVIQSFTIDHTHLKPGIYVSREDKGFTTFDLRITEPESCGNYLLHDLPMCKWECARYCDRLKNDFHSKYTKLTVRS